jgi:hypothetical protein
MKALFLLTCLVSTNLSLFSQTELEPIDIGWTDKKIELFSFADKDQKQHGLFLSGTDSIKGFVMNDEGAIAHTYGISRLDGDKMLGGFIKGGKTYIYLYNTSDQAFHVVVFEGDSIRENPIHAGMGKEKELEKLSCGDHFVYLALTRKGSELVLYDFWDEKKFDSVRYHSEDDLWKRLTKGNIDLSRDIDVGEAGEDGDWSLEAAQNSNKLYYLHDSLFLVMNSLRGTTGVVAFDLTRKLVRSWQIIQSNFVAPEDDRSSYSDNSFLLEGKLYYVQATFDSLFVQVNDFYSGGLIKRFATKRKEDIDFKNTQIILTGDDKSSNESKGLDKTRQLLNKMVNGRAFITARRGTDGRVILTVGSYSKITRSSGGGYFAGGGKFGGPTIYAGVGRTTTWTMSARFKAMLDGTNFGHIEGDIDPAISEKSEYRSGKDAMENGEAVFQLGGGYIYAYYDMTAKMLRLTKL